MIDNRSLIYPLLEFNSKDDFYFVQILKRKKENPELGSNSYVAKSYCIHSIDYFEKKIPEMLCLATLHNARIMIDLNRKSFRKSALQMLRKVTEQILNEDYSSVKKAFESIAGTFSNEPNKKWIVNIDVKDEDFVKIVENDIKNCEPNRRQLKTLAILPSKNGFHIITSPFNRQEFSKIHTGLQVHTCNPTNLIIL